MTKPSNHWSRPDPEHGRRLQWRPQERAQAQAGPTPAWTTSQIEFINWVRDTGSLSPRRDPASFVSVVVSLGANVRGWELAVTNAAGTFTYPGTVTGTSSGNEVVAADWQYLVAPRIIDSTAVYRFRTFSDAARTAVLQTFTERITSVTRILPSARPDLRVTNPYSSRIVADWSPTVGLWDVPNRRLSAAANASDAASAAAAGQTTRTANAIYSRTTKRYTANIDNVAASTRYTVSAGGATASLTTSSAAPPAAPQWAETADTATSATITFVVPTNARDPYLQVFLGGQWRTVSNPFTIGAGDQTWNPALTATARGAPYSFRARWVNSDGPTNGAETTVSGMAFASAPAIPRTLVVANARVSVQVGWTAPSTTDNGPAASYDYAIRDVQVASGSLSALVRDGNTTNLQHTFTTLADGTDLIPRRRYWVYVRAVNSFGSSDWVEAAAQTTPQEVPDDVIVVTASAVRTTTARVHWTEDEKADGYEIRRGARGDWIPVGDVRQYDATGLRPGTPYTFYVRAANVAGRTADPGQTEFVTMPEAALTAGLRTAGRGLYDLDVDWGDTLDYDHPEARMNDRARVLEFTYASGDVGDWGDHAIDDGLGVIAMGTLTMGNADDLFTPQYGSFRLTPQEILGSHRFRVRRRGTSVLMFQGILQRASATAVQRGRDAETQFNLVGIFDRGLIAPFTYPENLANETPEQRAERYPPAGSSIAPFFQRTARVAGTTVDSARTSYPPYDPSVGFIEGLVEWPPFGLEASEATVQRALFAFSRMWNQPTFPTKDGRFATRDVRGIGTGTRKVIDADETVIVAGNDDAVLGPMDNVIDWAAVSLNPTSLGEVRPPQPRNFECTAQQDDSVTVGWNPVTEATSYLVSVTGAGVNIVDDEVLTNSYTPPVDLTPSNVYTFRIRSKRGNLLSGFLIGECPTADAETPDEIDTRLPVQPLVTASAQGALVSALWTGPTEGQPGVLGWQLTLQGPDGTQLWQKSLAAERRTDSFTVTQPQSHESAATFVLWVAGQNQNGTGPRGSAPFPVQPAGDVPEPIGVSCTESDGDVTITWTAPAGIVRFILYRATDSVATVDRAVSPASYVFQDEQPGTRLYGVASVNATGEVSTTAYASCEVGGTGLEIPSVVLVGESSPRTGEGRVEWQLFGGGTATGYQYRRSMTRFEPDAISPAWATADAVVRDTASPPNEVVHTTGLSDSQTWYYQWRSTRTGETPVNSPGVFTVNIPAPGIVLTAPVAVPTAAATSIDWDVSGGTNATGYQYRRSTTRFSATAADTAPLNWLPATPIARDAAPPTEVSHTGLTGAGTTWYYQWRSVRTGVTFDAAAHATAVTSVRVGVPPVTVPDPVGFRATPSGPDVTPPYVTLTFTLTGNATGAAYRFTSAGSIHTGAFVPVTSGTRISTGIEHGEAYDFQLRATRGTNYSDPPVEQNNVQIPDPAVADVPPGAPTGLSVTATSNGFSDGTWTAPAEISSTTTTDGRRDAIPFYNYQWAVTTGTDTNEPLTADLRGVGEILGTTASALSYTEGEADTDYRFWVRAINPGDALQIGPWASEPFRTLVEETFAPGPVTGLTATYNNTTGDVDVSWTAPADTATTDPAEDYLVVVTPASVRGSGTLSAGNVTSNTTISLSAERQSTVTTATVSVTARNGNGARTSEARTTTVSIPIPPTVKLALPTPSAPATFGAALASNGSQRFRIGGLLVTTAVGGGALPPGTAVTIYVQEYEEGEPVPSPTDAGWTVATGTFLTPYKAAGSRWRLAVQARTTAANVSDSDVASSLAYGPSAFAVQPTGLRTYSVTAAGFSVSVARRTGYDRWRFRYRIGTGAWTTLDRASPSATVLGRPANTTFEVQAAHRTEGGIWSDWDDAPSTTVTTLLASPVLPSSFTRNYVSVEADIAALPAGATGLRIRGGAVPAPYSIVADNVAPYTLLWAGLRSGTTYRNLQVQAFSATNESAWVTVPPATTVNIADRAIVQVSPTSALEADFPLTAPSSTTFINVDGRQAHGTILSSWPGSRYVHVWVPTSYGNIAWVLLGDLLDNNRQMSLNTSSSTIRMTRVGTATLAGVQFARYRTPSAVAYSGSVDNLVVVYEAVPHVLFDAGGTFDTPRFSGAYARIVFGRQWTTPSPAEPIDGAGQRTAFLAVPNSQRNITSVRNDTVEEIQDYTRQSGTRSVNGVQYKVWANGYVRGDQFLNSAFAVRQ